MRTSAIAVITLLILGWGSGTEIWSQDSTHSNNSPTAALTPSREDPSVVDLMQQALRFKRKLDDRGIGGTLTFVNDWSRNFLDSANSRGSINRYSLDVSIKLDTRKSLGWDGGTGFFRYKSHIGETGSDYVGDAQGFSNIDDIPRSRLYELWFAQGFAENRLRFKAGKIDANADFASVHIAGDFLNSSMGYSPTILALPTYPEPKPGINIFVVPKTHYQVGAGWFRAAGDLDMLLLEGARDWLAPRELPGRFALGMWRLTGAIPSFDGDQRESTQGMYLVTEQSIWHRSRPDPAGAQVATLFLQYGHSNGEVSRFTHHLGGGVVLSGLLPSRSHDAFGVAVTTVRFTDEPEAGYQPGREVVVETYYKIGLGKIASIVPDVQFIHNPGGLLSGKDAVVLTPRVNLSF